MGEIRLPWTGWTVFGLIGRGAFGTVYEIHKEIYGNTRETAAVKVLTIPDSQSEVEELRREGYDTESIHAHLKTCLEEVLEEYSVMLKLRGHKNIVYCDDIQYLPLEHGVGWNVFIKMELLQPLSKTGLQDYNEQDVIRLSKDISSALDYCSEQKIIHRDVKPQNIFVSKDGTYKLGDFGIAKTFDRTMSGSKTGTAEYMAPEVCKCQPYGASADIYSLGLVMYWMMNRRTLPFMPPYPQIPTARQKESGYNQRISGKELPRPVNGSEELQRIMRKACACDPALRYHRAQELLADLNNMGKTGGSAAVSEPSVKTIQDRTQVKKTERAHPVSPAAEGWTPPKGNRSGTGGRYDRKQETNTKTTKSLWIALTSVTLLGILALAVGLGFHKMPGNESAHDQTELNHQTEINHQTEMTRPSAVSHEWSEWTDTMPSSVSESGYEIESRTLYSSRTLEKTSSAEDSMPGWELYDTKTVDDGYGEWSGWSSDYVSESEDREVEEKTWYRYRDEETTTSSSSNKSGWELYDTTWDQWGDYGSWSGWTDSYMSSSNSCDVESKNQYRTRSISYREEYTPWSEWGGWSFDRQSTGDTCEEDERTVWGYYYFLCPNCGAHMHGWGECYKWAGGCGAVTKLEHGQQIWSPIPWNQAGLKDWHGTGKLYTYLNGELVFKWDNGDGDPRSQYRYRTRSTQQVKEYGDWQGWTDGDGYGYSSEEVETRTLYRYREREMLPTYHYCRWSGWSDWQPDYVSGNDSRQVETDTYYRYRDQLTSDTYYFQRWTDWTDYSDQKIEANDEREVRTQTQYRYRKK